MTFAAPSLGIARHPESIRAGRRAVALADTTLREQL